MAPSPMGFLRNLIASCAVVGALFVTVPAVASADGLLLVVGSGNGAGTVVGDPQGVTPIDCPSACGSLSQTDRTITLTATATEDSIFGGWSVQPASAIVSGCGTTRSCTVLVVAAPNLFVPGPGGMLIFIPQIALVTVDASFARTPAGVFLCYSRFQVDPGVWPATEADA